MKSTGSLAAIIMIAVLGICVIMVASVKKKPTITELSANANEFGELGTAAFGGPEHDPFAPEVSAVLIDDGRLVIGTDRGLFVMPMNIRKPGLAQMVEPERRDLGDNLLYLNTIFPLGDARFAGGYGLYKLDSDYSAVLGQYYPGEMVNTVMEFGDGLLVGTDHGLWYHCNAPIDDETVCSDTLLKDGIVVTALATDPDGLWVGTYGDGLFYYDGNSWRERYLLRDTLVFSFVNAIEYSSPYLWVGTDEGLFRYNGGQWSQIFASDSSDVFCVNAIMSAPSATYIAAENGVMKFSSDKLEYVERFQGMPITGFCLNKKDIIVATRNNGIYKFNGKEEIVSPEQLTSQLMVEIDKNKVYAETAPEASARETDR